MKRISTLLLTLACSLPALAGEILIPAVYRGPGASGSVWRTEIIVADVSTTPNFPVGATVTFYPTGGTPMEVELPLEWKQTYTIHDAMQEWFGVVEGGGIVRVTWDEPAVRITARARIYNVTANGEFGQGVPGLPLADLQLDNFLPGVSGTGVNRTNIGVSNPHDEVVQFWIELFDASGDTRGSFSNLIQPRSFRQFNDIFSFFQTGPLDGAMVRVLAINKPLYAYASIVRSDSGDPTFVIPAR
jgi:hypothetical protein